MNVVLVARDRDADLIPSNVKAGVTIDDTLGTYTGGIWWLAEVTTLGSVNTVCDGNTSSIYSYYIVETTTDILALCRGAFNNNTVAPWFITIWTTKSTGSIAKTSWQIDVTTNVIDSVYLDTGVVYFNTYILPFHYETYTYTIATATWVSTWVYANNANFHLTGTLLTAWPKVLTDGKTYTIWITRMSVNGLNPNLIHMTIA